MSGKVQAVTVQDLVFGAILVGLLLGLVLWVAGQPARGVCSDLDREVANSTAELPSAFLRRVEADAARAPVGTERRATAYDYAEQLRCATDPVALAHRRRVLDALASPSR